MTNTKEQILKQYFGYDTFRGGQAELVDAVLSGQDVLGIMPTGAGKSLCYQVPALVLPGITLVISPLISLMRDQVLALVANGVSAAFINSSLTDAQLRKAMANAVKGVYKIIYVAPERLLSPSMLELAQNQRISLVAVDEAHCISRWGQDFRPHYLDIPKFIRQLPTRPILAAFTATATTHVRDDVTAILDFINPLVQVTGFDRPNLYFEVKQPVSKYAELLSYLETKSGKAESGIIYCSTRKEVENLAEKLTDNGYPAAPYHAGLDVNERNLAQDDFLHDRVKLIVATNAFGMGIDKSNVRFVIHYNMPQSVESYYQEAGRAGRDGLPADCILYYARKDISTAIFLISQSENKDEIARNKKLLNHMERYCESDGCLRWFILAYFGEWRSGNCDTCANCLGSFTETDITLDAQKVLSHIGRINKMGKRFMFTHTADILLGKSSDYRDLPTFGLMSGFARKYIRRITGRLTALGYINDDGFLSITPKAREVLLDGQTVSLRTNDANGSDNGRINKAQRLARDYFSFSDDLFDRLKALRLDMANEENVPAFVVFSDATLVDMCIKHPQTADEMLQVSGVGQVKFSKYGMRFLELLCGEERSDGGGYIARSVLDEETFFREVEIYDGEIPVSRISDNINIVLIKYGKNKTSPLKLNNIMLEAGLLEHSGNDKIPTSIGRENGLSTVRRTSGSGEFIQCLYNADAQRMCVEMFWEYMD
ncbi:MAG: DNA helicase RecQ [Defluviitaleaceae bacterium]|nr:DNA helicase RecQ [Defluviitaleaceae bacterium]